MGEALRDRGEKLQGDGRFADCGMTPPAMLPWTHLKIQGSEYLLLQTAAHHEFGQLTWRGRKSFGGVDASTWDLSLSFKSPGKLFGIWFVKEYGSVWNRYGYLALWSEVAYHLTAPGNGQKGPGKRNM